jgi:branched-chain amino acid transport system substrate-binding protein
LIPKASVDKIPVLSMAYGLSASARGDVFPWVFNPPATYWDGLAMIIRYLGTESGGLDKLKGKKIGYIYFDGGFGKEPIPLFEQMAKDMGFELKLYPVPPGEMQNQSSQWLSVRRDRPDFMVMYGWGAMNPTAEATETACPSDQMSQNPPVSAKGTASRISSASSTRRNVRYSSKKMMASVNGTTMVSRCEARSRYSNCPDHAME